MANSYVDQKELGPEDVLPMGKYKGWRIIDVLRNDADYLAWVVDNIDDFDLDDEIHTALEDDCARQDLLEDYS